MFEANNLSINIFNSQSFHNFQKNKAKSLKKIKFLRYILFLGFSFFIINYIMNGIYLLLLPQFFHIDGIYSLYLGILFISALFYIGFSQEKDNEIFIPLLLIGILATIFFWSSYKTGFLNFAFLVYFILIIAQLLFLIIVAGILISIKIKRKTLNVKLRNQRKIINSITIILILVSSIFMILFNSNLFAGKNIIITPQNYQMKLAFWGSINPNSYTFNEKTQMNQYSISIISSCSISSLSSFERNAENWLENYPRISIYACIDGFPGIFDWDGNAQNITQNAEYIMNQFISENLTNIQGIYFDSESPINIPISQSIPNSNRNNNATQIWEQFFNYIDQTFGSRFQIKITFYDPNFIGLYQNNLNLQKYMRNNIFSNPNFTEYAPMEYLGMGFQNNQTLNAERQNYQLYQSCELIQNGLKLGNLDNNSAGITLGLSGSSIFNPSNKIIGIGTGYNELINQSLIVKSFGFKTLTIFSLNSGSDSNGQWSGIFDAYGSNFLQNFENAINSQNSSQSFQIKQIYSPQFFIYFSIGIWMNWYIDLAAIGIFLLFIGINFYRNRKNKKIRRRRY